MQTNDELMRQSRMRGEDFDAMIRLPNGGLMLLTHKTYPLEQMSVAQLARLALELLEQPIQPTSLRV